jgi:NhaA family Na+:H+ antiporter
VGVVLGLLLGKPLGILLFVGLAVGLRMVQLPNKVDWMQITGVACACGIGFTMSLFIAGLAFEHGGGDNFAGDRLGIVLGSILSALIAYLILHFSLPRAANAAQDQVAAGR